MTYMMISNDHHFKEGVIKTFQRLGIEVGVPFPYETKTLRQIIGARNVVLYTYPDKPDMVYVDDLHNDHKVVELRKQWYI